MAAAVTLGGTIAEEAPLGAARAEILFRLARLPRNFVEAVELCERGLLEAGDDSALERDRACAGGKPFLAGDGERAKGDRARSHG